MFVLVWSVAAQPFLAYFATAQDDEVKEQRLKFMEQRLDEFQLALPNGDPLPRTEKPILRFSNPVRDSFCDGIIHLWLDGGVPVAVASLWIREDDDFGRDFVSLHETSLECSCRGKMVWSPKAGAHVRQPLPGAPQASDSTRLRLVQMRRMAARFKGNVGAWPAEGWAELRLLTQPVYRYASRTRGIIDGAVFVLAQANDPEMILVLEIVQTSGDATPAWRYSLARMTAVRLRAELDGKAVWSVNAYGHQPRSIADPYVEEMEGKFE